MNKPRECTIAQTYSDAVVERSHDVTLRVNNLKVMKQFYQQVLGLQLLGEFPSAVLLKRSDGSCEQIQMLALLQRSIGAGPGRNAAGRISLNMPIEGHEMEKKRLQSLGLKVGETNHEGIEKRALCFRDPEGNEVKLLFRNPTLDS